MRHRQSSSECCWSVPTARPHRVVSSCLVSKHGKMFTNLLLVTGMYARRPYVETRYGKERTNAAHLSLLTPSAWVGGRGVRTPYRQGILCAHPLTLPHRWQYLVGCLCHGLCAGEYQNLCPMVAQIQCVIGSAPLSMRSEER